jgi:hypothetical protein
MSKEEKLEQLVREKTWINLTEQEREFIFEELGSEEMFRNLQQLEVNLNRQADNIFPNKESLQILRSKFREHHNTKSWVQRWITFPTPAYAALSLVVLAVWIGWMLGSASGKSAVVYQQITKIDTVYFASKPDTVFLTKVIYKNVSPHQAIFTSVDEPMHAVPENHGVSMKEKEELNSFIVSGSE